MLRLDDDLINCSLSLLIPEPVAFAGAAKRSTHTASGGEKRKEIAVITFPPPRNRGMQISQSDKGWGVEKVENLIKWKCLYNEQSKKA